MSPLANKFGRYFDVLFDVVNDNRDLRKNDRHLWRKIHKYYVREGVIFTGDTQLDYNILVNYLYEDLFVPN